MMMMIQGSLTLVVLLLQLLAKGTLAFLPVCRSTSDASIVRTSVTTSSASCCSCWRSANHRSAGQQQQQRESPSVRSTKLMAHQERRQHKSRTNVLDPAPSGGALDGDIECTTGSIRRQQAKRKCDDNDYADESFVMAMVKRTSNIAPTPQLAAATTTLAATAAITAAFSSVTSAFALDLRSLGSVANLTPETFQPVCGASDGFYRFLQQGSVTLIGSENYDQYKPLIAGGLLRVRLELCVVESFLNEAVVPFIRDNGLSWVLPLHETVETFIAGAVFAFATTFVFIGSTKILTVIVTYTDFLFGLPARLVGGFAFDRAQNKPVTFDVGIGRFKTRVVGPSEEELDNLQPLDITKQSIPTVIVLLLSGTVNYFGKGLGVRCFLAQKQKQRRRRS
jgi:hypothetical protein